MRKSRGADAKLMRLRELRDEPVSAAQVAELRQALADTSGLVVATAAEIVGSRGLTELASELVAAFDRFMIDSDETDKQCRAKIAIVEALNKIDYDKEDVFLRGLRHVQVEGPWPGEDKAARLRGLSAFGLVRINYHDVVIVLADLLADKEFVARVAAAQALGETRSPSAIPLLRFKARIGDKEPEVTAECLKGLMVADAKESLPFVAKFLHAAGEEVQEGAAFALAESRRPDALDVLQKHWPTALLERTQEALLLAISMTRLPAALDFLLEILATEKQTAAMAALNALAIHRHNKAIHERVTAAVAKQGDDVLLERFKKKFEMEN